MTLFLLLGEFRDSVLPVLRIATEDTLIEDLTAVISQLQGVHPGALEPVESLLAVLALNCCAFGLTAVAGELLFMHQQLQGLADIDPLLALHTELGVQVQFDAVLMEVQRLANQLGLLFVLKLAEGAHERVVCFPAEGAELRDGLVAQQRGHGRLIDELIVMV